LGMSERLSYIKRESVIGLPVIDGKTNRKLGIVKDFYTNKGNTHVEGLFVARDGWGNNDLDISFSGVTIGTDAIIAEGGIQQGAKSADEASSLDKLLKKRAIREDGQELGIISDILIDPITGRIEGLELSVSVLDDLLTGRRIIPNMPYEQGSGDVIVVSLDQAAKIESYNRGIKNIFLSKI